MTTSTRTGAQFTYSIKAASGFRSKLEGRLRGPEHHGVCTAACDGQLSDNINVLTVAEGLLAALKGLMPIAEYEEMTDEELQEEHRQGNGAAQPILNARAAIAKAEGAE